MATEKRITRNITTILTAICIGNGVLAFLSYILDSFYHFTFTEFVRINPITALAFTMNGLWLLLYQKNPRQAKLYQYYVAGLLLVSTGFKLLELVGVSTLAFDRILFWGIINKTTYFKPLGPYSTILLGISGMVVLFANKKNEKLLYVSDILKVCGFLISYLAVIGYIFRIEVVFQVGEFLPLAFNSAAGYLSFFIVSILLLPYGEILRVINSRHIGSKMVRNAIPVILIIPIVFGSIKILIEEFMLSYFNFGNNLLFDSVYGTALESVIMVLMVLIFLFFYAKRLNQQDKKRTIAELQTLASERRYRTLVSALREGVVYFNINGIVSFCNPSFLKITGYEEPEVMGKNFFDFFVDTSIKEKYLRLIADVKFDLAEVFEEQLRTTNGDAIWVSMSVSPVYSEEGSPVAALATLVDITEKRKQLEDIEAYSASAAHDLNAPLARIEMIALLLLDSVGETLDTENKELLEAIAGISANMRALLKDLLQFSKLGVSGVVKNEVDTALLVKEVLEANMHINPIAKVSIGQLPMVRADRAMLKQVLTNLVSNALKYSGQKEKPQVEIGSYEEAGKTVIYVRDNGAGFDMAQAHKLFAAFQRLHVEFEGNGLGLPIVKRIIEKHGGKIWANAKPGEGAVFYFTLS